jgi:lysophospholipase L1-like esterase
MEPVFSDINQLHGRLKMLLRFVLRQGAILLLLAAPAEVALQTFAPRYRDQVFDQRFTGGWPIGINEHGYRGPALDPRKQPGELRVVAMGDSTTFGTGVDAAQAWPGQLEQVLRKVQPKRPVSVLNAGFPAVNLREMRVAFEQEWAAYHPDVVILAISNNMVSFGWIKRGKTAQLPENRYLTVPVASGWAGLKQRANRAVHKLCLPTFLNRNSQRVLFALGLASQDVDIPAKPFGPMLAFGWRQPGLDPAMAAQAWELFGKDLADLRDSIRGHRCKFIVTYLPSRFMLSNSWRDNEKWVPKDRLTIDPAHRITLLCSSLNIPFVDAQQALRARRQTIDQRTHRFEPLYIPMDFTHLNAQGHQAVAAALEPRVEEW